MDTIQNKKKTLTFVFLIVVFVVVIILVQNIINTNSKIQQKETEKNTSVSMKEFAEKQKEVFGQREAVNPKDSSVKRELSLSYYLLGDYKKAEALIKEAIALDDSNPQFYVDFGHIYEAKMDFVKAEEQYKKAVDLIKQASKLTVIPESPQNISYKEASDFIKKAGELAVVFEPLKDIPKELAQPSQSEGLQKNAINIIPTPFTSLARLYLDQKKH